MNTRNEFVEQYQCPGCINGDNCFDQDNIGIGCKNYRAGTIIMGLGKFVLGLPKGFCRLGKQDDLIPKIFKTIEEQDKIWKYDELNVPIWKHKTVKGHIIIRGYLPRLNAGFIHIIIEGDFNRIKAFEITEKYMEGID